MTLKAACVFFIVVAVGVWPAEAQAQTGWAPQLSGFAGFSAVPSFDVAVADPATATTLDIQDRKILNTTAWGGSLGLWKRSDGGRLRWGVRAEALRQKVRSNPQVLQVNGTLGGQPYVGPLPFPSADGSATFMTALLMLGIEVGDRARIVGRLTPYAGVGGGINRVRGTIGSSPSNDTGGVFSALGGVSVGLGRRVSAFAEYRFSRASQTIQLGSQSNVFSVRPNHVVSGLSVGF